MGRTLLVTNDFPPRPGGIQAFVHGLAERQPHDSLVVFSSNWRGAEKFDAEQSFPVIREATSVLLPTPRVTQRAADIAQVYRCDSAWFGAAAPLGLMAPALRRAGIQRVIAQTHGHEVGWAALPGTRRLLRRVARHCDVVTYLGEYTRSRLDPVIGDVTQLDRLAPGVDSAMFRPDVDGSAVRRKYGLENRPVIVCVSRLVTRKGQDTLIRALPQVRAQVPDAALLLVGGGPAQRRLRRLATELDVADHVVITGSVPWSELPSYYRAGDVFAMPCRTRRAGLDVEGLGIVFLEASASGLPVVVGDSGGATDAVREGITGYTVDGRDIADVAGRCAELLSDTELASRMGKAGREWVETQWRWETQADHLRHLLHPR